MRNPVADVSLAQVGEMWGIWAAQSLVVLPSSERRAPTSPKRGPQAGGAISACRKHLNEMPTPPHPQL